MNAHRVSWTAFFGQIPDGLNVCHHCDVRSCINPDHLFLGTQAENMADMDAKKRRVTPEKFGKKNPMFGRKHSQVARSKQSAAKQDIFVGSKHPRATVNEHLALAIKQAKGSITAKQASEAFGASWHVVRNIWAGKSWGFVNG